jgi:AraC-like DNA-binding protein
VSEPTRESVRIRTDKSPTLSAFPLTDGTPDSLIVQWRELAEILRAEGCPEVAAARERCANELETVLHTTKNEPLSINQAAQESGYSAEYLRRLLRETPALNIGRVGKPLIRRRDLPRKATTTLVGRTPKRYDVAADAQSLVGRQGVI